MIVVREQRHDHAVAAAIRTNFHLLRSLSRDSFVQSSSDVPARRYETIEVLRCTTRVRGVFQPFSSHVKRVSRYEKSVKKCVKSIISLGNQCVRTNRENLVKYPYACIRASPRDSVEIETVTIGFMISRFPSTLRNIPICMNG